MTGAFRGFYSHDTSLVCFGWLAVNEDKSCCFEMGNTARMFLCGQESVTSVAFCGHLCTSHCSLYWVLHFLMSVRFLCLSLCACLLWDVNSGDAEDFVPGVCVHLNPALSLTSAAPCRGTWGWWGSSDLGAWGHSQALFPGMMLEINCSSLCEVGPAHPTHSMSCWDLSCNIAKSHFYYISYLS